MSKTTLLDVGGEAGLADVTASTNGHQPALDYEFTINGKAVRLKRTLSAKAGRWIPKITRKMQQTGDLFDQIPLACLLIESWDYPGDPSTPEAYDDFELFELMALLNAVGEHISERNDHLTTKN